MSNHIVELSIPFGASKIHPILLVDDNNVILVDCGYVGALPLLEQALNKYGFNISDLTGLVLTHHDHDHMGSAAELRRLNPRLKIYASELETPHIEQTITPARLEQALSFQAALPIEKQHEGLAFIETLRRVDPVKVDIRLQDKAHLDWCGGVDVIFTPGHTPGHMSLFVEKENAVIVGDAMVIENGMLSLANPHFTIDIEKAKTSMKQLLNMRAKTYYCYHGGFYKLP